jgi:hypothetical protein
MANLILIQTAALVALLLSVQASAQLNNTLDWQFGLRNVNLKEFSTFKEGSDLNPSLNTAITNLRWTQQFQYQNWSYLLSPRLYATYSQDANSTGEAFMQDAYGQWSNSNHQLRLGIQNFQWGPSELLSPSNPIFAFESNQRWFFYQQRGRSLAKWHWTINKSWAFSAVAEPANNGEVPPIEGESFHSSGLIKIEFHPGSGQNYIGLTAGMTPQEAKFWGEYFAFYITDSLSVYNDTRFTQGNRAYYPVTTASGIELQQTHRADTTYSPLTVNGIRLETSTDLRLEYVYNELGMDHQEWKQSLFSIVAPTPNLVVNRKRFERSGQNIPGKNLLYLSWRIPDLGPRGVYSLHLRTLRSLDDQSGNLQAAIERGLGDAFTVYLEGAKFYGSSDSFFGGLLSYEILAGFKWTH